MAKNNPIHNNHCIKNKITVKAAIFINQKNKKLQGTRFELAQALS